MRWKRKGAPRGGSGKMVVGLVLVAIVVAVVVAIRAMQPAKPVDVNKPEDKIAQAKDIKPGKDKGLAVTKVKESPQLAAAQQLFAVNCAQCHGDKGEGDGAAARYLHPKPRNFSEGNFRIVSTVNKKPSDQDLLHVISNGMPGSMMIPFGHLSEADRTSLVAYVRHLTLTGLVEQRKKALVEAGEEVDLPALTQKVAKLLQPGTEFAVPKDLPPSTPESVAMGKELYLAKGCASCHGKEGKGDGSQEQKNTDGTPTRPRDLTLGLFKGGRDPAQLFLRSWLGLPGSPMPDASAALKPEELGHVNNFINSLSTPALTAQVEFKRTQVVAKKIPALGDDLSADVWQSAPVSAIVVSPLWWRSFVLPELKVAAVHDGANLAIRLTWLDASKNDSVLRPEDFEDMAAVQLFKGKTEPFLGMGAAPPSPPSKGGEGGGVDLWLWRASWQRQVAGKDYQLDDYPFDMPIYSKFLKGKDAPGFLLPPKAVGNHKAHADPQQSAGNLTAKGFGSTTFRPKASQVVTARSSWEKGQWTVVLRRSLNVAADDGLSLAPGDQGSVAFAIWDGLARDRNGQKLVSIWHDLKLE